MDWVRPAAIWAMAAVVPATGPPSPIFSPPAVQCTPAAVSLSPSAGSPGHWWESPQPPAISRLCADELASSPAVTVSAGSPAPAAGGACPGGGEPERDGLVPVGCARAVTWRGGTVTTAGGTTTVTPAALAAQEAVPAAPQPAAMVRESSV